MKYKTNLSTTLFFKIKLISKLENGKYKTTIYVCPPFGKLSWLLWGLFNIKHEVKIKNY